jgi:hypothetical protein
LAAFAANFLDMGDDELMTSIGRYAELFNMHASLFLDAQVSAD